MLNLNDLVAGSILTVKPYLSKHFTIGHIKNINELEITYEWSSWMHTDIYDKTLSRTEFVRLRVSDCDFHQVHYLPTYYEDLMELL